MKNQRSTHGGARKGAGRKPLYGKPLAHSVQVGLAEIHFKAIKRWRREHPDCDSAADAIRGMIETASGLAAARRSG